MQQFIYIILILLPTYLIRFEIVGIPVTFLELLILLLFLFFIIKNKGRFVLGSYKYKIALILIAGLLGTIYSPDLRSALGILKAYIIEPILFFIVFINVKPDFKQTLKALACGGVFIASAGILQYFTGYGIPSPWNMPGAEYRITSIYDYPNAVGLFLAPLIILALGLYFKGQKKLGWWSFILLGLSAVIFSKAQGAYIAIGSGIFYLGLTSKLWRKICFSTLILGMALCFIIPATRATLLFQDNSGQVRLALWQGTANLLMHNPITGAGLAGFQIKYPEYKLNRHTEALLYSHNLFLDFWCQLGILGLIWLIWVVFKFFKTRPHNYDPRNIILNAAMCGILVYGLVDVPYFKNDLALIFWTLLALKEINK